MATCKVCGRQEELASPLTDGVCHECLRAGKRTAESRFDDLENRMVDLERRVKTSERNWRVIAIILAVPIVYIALAFLVALLSWLR